MYRRTCYSTANIIFGCGKNTRIALRKNRAATRDIVSFTTPDILSDKEFRGFWISWGKGIIRAGREGKSTALLMWEDPEPFPIKFVGVTTCCGCGSTGVWNIEDSGEVVTPDNWNAYIFRPVLAGSVEFEFRGLRDCSVALTSDPNSTEHTYHIILGGWSNKRSSINNMQVETPNLVDSTRFKKFVIEWRKGLVKVRDETNHVFMERLDSAKAAAFGITHFGIRTNWGVTGEWRIPTIQLRNCEFT